MSRKLLFFNLPLTQRLEIRKLLLGKYGGVYIFQNKINGKRYVGSSINIVKRISNYYDLNRIKTSLIISKALEKYGLDSFTLQIFRVPNINKEAVLALEQYLIDSLKPEYNILKIAGSSAGHKHSKEFKERQSAINLARNWEKRIAPKLEFWERGFFIRNFRGQINS
jgi:group I intron endonuclease